jgi:hypothetical protein
MCLSRRSVPHCLSIDTVLTFRLSSSLFFLRENDTPAFWSEVIQALDPLGLKFAAYSTRQVTGCLVGQYHAQATLDPSILTLSS